MNLENLKAPFPPSEIKWRAGTVNDRKTKALAVPYIDARSVYDRLDDVCGQENWQTKIEILPSGVTVAGIGILINGDWVWKMDGAPQTNYEGEKGGISDAIKRSGVHWGIARYLYSLGGVWVRCQQQGKNIKLTETPALPSWALPEGERKFTSTTTSTTTSTSITQDKLERPLAPDDLKRGLVDRAENKFAKTKVTNKIRSFIDQGLDALFLGNSNMTAFLQWLYDADSVSHLKDGQVMSLMTWMNCDENAVPSHEAVQEAALVSAHLGLVVK